MERYGWLLCRAPETQQIAISFTHPAAKALDPAEPQSDNAEEFAGAPEASGFEARPKFEMMEHGD